MDFDLPLPSLDLTPERPKQTLSAADPQYPRSLFELEVPPWFLFYDGELAGLASEMVAVVGARDIDEEGIRLARWCGRTLASQGVSVVSGGARGVDYFAHAGVVDVGGKGVIVAPHGLATVSPKSSESVYRDVRAQGGVILSEYPAAMRPRRYTFHRRNQLIAALGSSLIVVRARERSGTMLTVSFAQELARPIFAVPGVPDDQSAVACNRLIADGRARMFLGQDSDTVDLRLAGTETNRMMKLRADFTVTENRILDAAEFGGEHWHDLDRDLTVQEILAVRTALEMDGFLSFDPDTGEFKCRVDRAD